MIFDAPVQTREAAYRAVLEHYRCDEAAQVHRLIKIAQLPPERTEQVTARATGLVQGVRAAAAHGSGMDAFMRQYDLSSQEGVVLMCLAEALLRIPDGATADRLIEDKIGSSDWERHLGTSASTFVNASTWALMLTGRILRHEDQPQRNFRNIMQGLVRRGGEPMIRQAVRQAMRIMGRQFVLGRTIEEALRNARTMEQKGCTHSYDMLGEAARTEADAQRYFTAYEQAIAACGRASAGRGPIASPGVSVKLSALHARYELAQRQRVLGELLPRMRVLARQAAQHDINLTVDAEEAARLDLSLEIFERLSGDPDLRHWQGLGLAVQAYQKRALDVIAWLATVAERDGRRIMTRLVKGAYWDTEIKLAQEQGLDGYPVFTRKVNTDVSYMACARQLLADRKHFYAQLATHNAHTVAYVREVAGHDDFEFQRLHGMGEALYAQAMAGAHPLAPACRIYAPVGAYEDLLAYLVRRLLENGANSSFVNRIVDEKEPVARIVADPVAQALANDPVPHPRIVLPAKLYGAQRPNSRGPDLSDVLQLDALAAGMATADAEHRRAEPLVSGVQSARQFQPVRSPADHRRIVGEVSWATPQDMEAALAAAHAAASRWDATPATERAACLRRYADLLEADLPRLVALCAREAGKHIPDGVSEVREAVDFCRYYAAQVEAEFAQPLRLPGPTGERNTLGLHGRGVFVCISPWNFPLAIFTGQVTAALGAGNAVIAKPAEQTCLIGHRTVTLMHQAGIPKDVLQFVPGDGPTVGAPLVADARVAGVAFTGSLATAKSINRQLAAREGPIIPLIAETGGQNAMIVDSSALLEQVVADIVKSSFQSAGQRCSALRLLFVQNDIADALLTMLKGAMAELVIGDPWSLATDVTPVIDSDACTQLSDYARDAERRFRLIQRCDLTEAAKAGTFVAPQAFELDSMEQLGDEQFGPILHVIRYKSGELDAVVDAINRSGYGLTFGIHSRVDTTVQRVTSRIHAGNAYVNRNMIGAVVGVQPFGGEGLSGTGPKAGGPHYLHRFATERTVSVNTTAAGGNASLMSLQEDAPADAVMIKPEPQRYG